MKLQYSGGFYKQRRDLLKVTNSVGAEFLSLHSW